MTTVTTCFSLFPLPHKSEASCKVLRENPKNDRDCKFCSKWFVKDILSFPILRTQLDSCTLSEYCLVLGARIQLFLLRLIVQAFSEQSVKPAKRRQKDLVTFDIRAKACFRKREKRAVFFAGFFSRQQTNILSFAVGISLNIWVIHVSTREMLKPTRISNVGNVSVLN